MSAITIFRKAVNLPLTANPLPITQASGSNLLSTSQIGLSILVVAVAAVIIVRVGLILGRFTVNLCRSLVNRVKQKFFSKTAQVSTTKPVINTALPPVKLPKSPEKVSVEKTPTPPPSEEENSPSPVIVKCEATPFQNSFARVTVEEVSIDPLSEEKIDPYNTTPKTNYPIENVPKTSNSFVEVARQINFTDKEDLLSEERTNITFGSKRDPFIVDQNEIDEELGDFAGQLFLRDREGHFGCPDDEQGDLAVRVQLYMKDSGIEENLEQVGLDQKVTSVSSNDETSQGNIFSSSLKSELSSIADSQRKSLSDLGPDVLFGGEDKVKYIQNDERLNELIQQVWDRGLTGELNVADEVSGNTAVNVMNYMKSFTDNNDFEEINPDTSLNSAGSYIEKSVGMFFSPQSSLKTIGSASTHNVPTQSVMRKTREDSEQSGQERSFERSQILLRQIQPQQADLVSDMMKKGEEKEVKHIPDNRSPATGDNENVNPRASLLSSTPYQQTPRGVFWGFDLEDEHFVM